MNIDTHDIHFDQNDRHWKAQLDVAFVQLGKGERILNGVKDSLSLSLLPKTFEEAAVSGWSYSKRIYVNSKAQKLRVVIRDSSTGAIGSISVPIAAEKNSAALTLRKGEAMRVTGDSGNNPRVFACFRDWKGIENLLDCTL